MAKRGDAGSSSVPLAHLGTVQRTLDAWEGASNGVLSAAMGVVNATLSDVDTTLASLPPGSTLHDLARAQVEGQKAIDVACYQLCLSLEGLSAEYRDLKAACESVISSAEGLLQRQSGESSDERLALSSDVGTGAPSSATPSLKARALDRLHALLSELLEEYAAQLALTAAVVARLQPQRQGGMRAVQLPSFPFGPGLPPAARGDRAHLTALASTLALPPYVDRDRCKLLLAGCTHILQQLVG